MNGLRPMVHVEINGAQGPFIAVRSVGCAVALFEIGEKIEHTHLLFGDIRGLGDVDMYLGADFFLSDHVYVAYGQHKLYFTDNGGPVFALGHRYLIQRSGAAPVLAGPGASAVASAAAASAASAAELARQGSFALDPRYLITALQQANLAKTPRRARARS